jgi:hypothetical protein
MKIGNLNQYDDTLFGGYGGPEQEAEAPRFPNNQHMEVVRLSALGTDRTLPPRKYPRYSFFRGAGIA